jgi:hypothetical protein
MQFAGKEATNMVIHVTKRTINNEASYRVWSPQAIGTTMFPDIAFGSFYSLDSLYKAGFGESIKDSYWQAMKDALEGNGEYQFESTEGMGGPS